jgi:hypothetical protein
MRKPWGGPWCAQPSAHVGMEQVVNCKPCNKARDPRDLSIRMVVYGYTTRHAGPCENIPRCWVPRDGDD